MRPHLLSSLRGGSGGARLGLLRKLLPPPDQVLLLHLEVLLGRGGGLQGLRHAQGGHQGGCGVLQGQLCQQGGGWGG